MFLTWLELSKWEFPPEYLTSTTQASVPSISVTLGPWTLDLYHLQVSASCTTELALLVSELSSQLWRSILQSCCQEADTYGTGS